MQEKKPRWMDETIDHLGDMLADNSYTIDEIQDYIRAKLTESFKNGVDTQKNRKQRPQGQKSDTPRRSYGRDYAEERAL